jgi:thiamine biosynthesis lipoprotein
MRGFFAAFPLFVSMAVFNFGCESLQKFEYVQPKMGTGFRVVLYARDKATADRAAKAAFERVDQLNAIFSDYDSNSELSKLGQLTNDGPMTKPVAVSPDMWRILQAAYAASARSDGAFDITVGPFVRLWRRSRDLHELPTTQRLEQTRVSVGWQAMRLFPATHSVHLLKPHMRLDVGGIAKGYAAMECVALIRSFGIRRAMVGAAGDLTVGDPPPGRAYWRVAVQSLADPEKSDGYVKIRNASISTSGDTQRFIIIDGQRYSHIIDPRTGLGLTHRIGCTVISPDGSTSDWLCKPACVLGPERGLKLIDQTPRAAGRAVTLDEHGGEQIYESARWRDFVLRDGETAD